MPTDNEIAEQRELLATYRRNLSILLRQLALHGESNAPLHILNDIQETRNNIHRIKNILHEWGVPVKDHPDDGKHISLSELLSGQNRTNRSERNTIFISYSHSDRRWLERLHVHLKPLERDNTIVRWDDTMIKPGSKWREEIDKALKAAKVAILLVSADFLASDFITTNELPPLLKAAQEDGAVILPVIISACRFLQTPGLSQFQAVNPPSQPLVGLRRNNREIVFFKITEAVEETLKHSNQSTSLFTAKIPAPISYFHTEIEDSSANLPGSPHDTLINEVLRVDTRQLMGDNDGKLLEFSYKKHGNFLYMLNEIWSLIADKVSPWKYGLQWALRDRASGKVFFEELFKSLSEEHLNSNFVAYLETITWENAGLTAGMILDVIPLNNSINQ